ncbi:MAG: hypothetical protein ACKOW9_03445 [Candidatus Paceibacterota bacterium]
MDTSKQSDFPEFADNDAVWERDRRSVTSPCNHDWGMVYENEEGYICGQCAHTWVIDGNCGLLLASSRAFITSILDRLERVEEYLSNSYDLTNCAACDKWDLRENFVDLGSWYACHQHVPLAAADGGDTAEVMRRAAHFVKNSELYQSRSLTAVVLWEQLVAASGELAEYLGDVDDELAASSVVKLPKVVSTVLNVGKSTSLRELALKISSFVDAGYPSSRVSAAYLITLLNEAYRLRGIKSSDTLEDRSEESLREIAFRFDERYTEIAMELCGDGMQPGTVFDGEIANQALALLSRRAVSQMVEAFKSL